MQGTLEELTVDSRRFELITHGDAPSWLAEYGGRANALDGRTKIILPTAEAEEIQPVLDRLRADGRTIESVLPVRESLEDLFLRAVRDPVTGELLDPGATTRKRQSPPTQPPRSGAQGGAT